jgi:hypothetical protein
MSWVKVKSPQNKISLIPHTALEVYTRYGYKELGEEKPTPKKPVEEPKVVVEEKVEVIKDDNSRVEKPTNSKNSKKTTI